MKYEQSRTILSAQSAEQGKERQRICSGSMNIAQNSCVLSVQVVSVMVTLHLSGTVSGKKQLLQNQIGLEGHTM